MQQKPEVWRWEKGKFDAIGCEGAFLFSSDFQQLELYGCWTKNSGNFHPKMDGENNGKPY